MGDREEEEIRQRKKNLFGKDKEDNKSKTDTKSADSTTSKNEPPKYNPYLVIYIPKRLIKLSVLIGIIAALVVYVPRFVLPDYNSDYAALGQEGAALFRRFDRDGDDYLSVGEYEALFHQIVGNGLNVSEIEYIPEQEIEEDDQYLTLKAYFTPMQLDTMTKDMSETMFGHIESLAGLKGWTKVNHEWMNFGVRHFNVFFPSEISVGKVYELYTDGRFSLMSTVGLNHLSSNRFFPTKTDEKLIVLQRLFSMFHPRPFLETRFPPKGGVAVIRAISPDFIDIVFRIHAEFQLNEPPLNPFWFTPAQFTGNLIVSKDMNQIYYFNIFVPNDKRLNVDMEWLNGPTESENMEVDIGYMPLMVANITAPSRYKEKPDDFTSPVNTDPNLLHTVQNLIWSEDISQEEALRLLEVKMYPFKKVPYYNFTDTLSRAQKENKLIHSILLWGALDDQSC